MTGSLRHLVRGEGCRGYSPLSRFSSRYSMPGGGDSPEPDLLEVLPGVAAAVIVIADAVPGGVVDQLEAAPPGQAFAAISRPWDDSQGLFGAPGPLWGLCEAFRGYVQDARGDDFDKADPLRNNRSRT